MTTTLLHYFRPLPWLVVLLVLLGGARSARASHLLGGEMTYRYLDANGPASAPHRYEITVIIYNTCGAPAIRPAAVVGIYSQATGGQIPLTTANFATLNNGSMSIPQTSLDACTTPPVPPGCTITGNSQSYQQQKFVGVVNLPASPMGYYALWTDFTRNLGIANIQSPSDGQNMTLYSTLAPHSRPNSAPVFVEKAVANVCINDTTYILNNAVDADGDRLEYSFAQPYGNISTPPPSSFIPLPGLVPYAAPQYSAATPLGTTAGNYASINPSTGIAKYRTTAGLGSLFVVAIDVKEYRTIGGQQVLIGVTRRDMQLVVVSCPNTVAPIHPTAAAVAPTPRTFTMEAGSTLTIPLTATQAAGHPLTMSVSSVLLDGPGGYNATFSGLPGTLAAGNPAGSATLSSPSSPAVGTFVFAAGCNDARATPYDLTVIVKDDACAGKTVGDVLRITVVKPTGPTAIAGTLAVCGLPTQQTYTASGGTAPTVQWTVTGGTIVGSPTANPVTVSWPTAGAGTITAQGLTQYGCLVEQVTKNVTVSPAVTLTLSANQTICQGGSTTLAVSGGSAPYTLTGGAAPLSGPGPFVLSPSQTTTYTVTSSASSGCPATGQVTVTVNAAPVASAGAAVAVCPGGSATLGTPAVAGLTYSWRPTAGLSSTTAAMPTVTLGNATSAPLVQPYTLTVTNTATGCQASSTVAVTVNPLPVAATGAAVAICPGGTGQLGAAPLAGYSYSWSPATGLSSATAANPTVTLTNATSAPITRLYTLTVTSAAGCASTGTVAVTVSPPPTANAGAAVAICAGGTGQLGAAPVAGYSYSWSPNTGLSSATVANPSVTLANATSTAITQTYTLTVTNATGCTSSGTVTVTVLPLPVALPGAAVNSCAGGTGQLGAAPMPGLTYSWSPNTGLSSATVANPTVSFPNTTSAPITRLYTLTVTSAIGCTSTGTVAVTMQPAVTPGAIGADQTVCAGAVPAPLASLAAATGSNGTYAYQWESSPNKSTWTAIGSVNTPAYAPGPVAATTYFRRRVAAGACGVAYSNVVKVTTQPLLVPAVALAVPPAQCAGLPFTFTPTPTNAGNLPTYQWFVNGTAVSTGPTFTSSTLADGDVVRVVLTPTAGFCASGPAIATVRVSLTPVLITAVVISTATALPVCAGAPVVFGLDAATNVGTNPQYQWQIDGVPVAGATGARFTSTTLRDGQRVTLAIRSTNVCGQPATATSNAVPVAINPPVQISAGPDKTITVGESVVLEGTADGSYPVVWSPAQTLTFVGGNQLQPVAAPLVTTTYTLSAGAGYCGGRSTVTVTVLPHVRIPNAFSPNGDNDDDTWQIDNIEAYPGSRVLVFNRWGSKIFETDNYRRSSEWNGTMNGQPAPFGTYYYLITLGNGKSYTGPITIVR
jgi:gliding motility-associated-like protein